MASWLLCTRPYKRVSSANSLSVEHMPLGLTDHPRYVHCRILWVIIVDVDVDVDVDKKN